MSTPRTLSAAEIAAILKVEKKTFQNRRAVLEIKCDFPGPLDIPGRPIWDEQAVLDWYNSRFPPRSDDAANNNVQPPVTAGYKPKYAEAPTRPTKRRGPPMLWEREAARMVSLPTTAWRLTAEGIAAWEARANHEKWC